jgi:hypothetical protein
MGEIDAPLGEIESVGAGIEGVAPTLITLARAATGVTRTVSEPPATSAALDQMASRWAASATRADPPGRGRWARVVAVLLAGLTAPYG